MGTEMADPDARKSARVWLPPAPSSRLVGIMADDWRPDPEAIGPAIMAHYALHGALKGDPAQTVGWAADVLAARLGAIEPGVANPLTPAQASITIKDAALLLGMIAEIFGRSALPADDECRLPEFDCRTCVLLPLEIAPPASIKPEKIAPAEIFGGMIGGILQNRHP